MEGVLNLEELRTRGFLEEDFSDAELRAVESVVWETISLFTNRFFENRSLTLKLDGFGTKDLQLPVAISEITSLEEESLGTLIEGTDFVVYNRPTPDDRRDPKIVLLNQKFPVGNQNITVKGIFGYTDPSSSLEHPPKPLIEVAMRLMPIFFENILDDGERDVEVSLSKRGFQKEVTDKYSYSRFNRGKIESQLLDDPLMNAILLQYRKGNDIVSLDFV